ncbi:MAG: hypothetical protein MH472_11605 [Bacteroidia bacterium]|nr:hypothetical protein [Bacteroidia bacterium]
MKRFKKYIFFNLGVLFLLSSLLPGFTEQLNKIPHLVGHYLHHQQEHEEGDFISFLFMHYGDASHHKNEENHDDLPLFQALGSGLIFIHSDFSEYCFFSQGSARTELLLHKENSYFFETCGGVFQPPKNA